MVSPIDSLNNLMSVDEEDVKEKIKKYFEEMDLEDEEIEKRIGLATDIEKGFRNLFILMLTAQIVGESLSDRRDDFVDFAYHDYTDAMIENGYSTDEYYTGQGYVEQYARRRCEEIVDTAILHQADSYYFSTDHSIAIGEDETNAVGNYQREQMAIAQGYTMKTWVTFQDDKVRHSHRLLQGQTINIFNPFEVGTGLMMFPLDVSLGVNMKEVYNCRCICEYSGKKGDNKQIDTIENSTYTIDNIKILDYRDIDNLVPDENNAKAEDLVDIKVPKAKFDMNEVLSGVRKTKVGRDAIDYIENNDINIILFNASGGNDRGGSSTGEIKLYQKYIGTNMVAEQTIIHESIHLRYEIGDCQHAEAICFSFEKMHKENRDFLYRDEWDNMVALAKNSYSSYPWEVGDSKVYEQFNFIRERA